MFLSGYCFIGALLCVKLIVPAWLVLDAIFVNIPVSVYPTDVTYV